MALLRRISGLVRNSSQMYAGLNSFVSSPRVLSRGYRRPARPVRFSWRDYGIISEVQNQGNSSSCFARVGLSLMEALYAGRGNRVSLSIQEILDNVYYDMQKGGYIVDVYNWAIEKGVSLEQDYRPYKGDKQDPTPFNKDRYLRDLFFIDAYGRVDCHEDALIKALLKHPVAANITLGPNFTKYDGGIFFGDKTLYKITDGSGEEEHYTRHFVEIVGFGEEGRYKYFEVKNTWGKGWGEDGYIRIWRDPKVPMGVNGLYTYLTYPVLFPATEEVFCD